MQYSAWLTELAVFMMLLPAQVRLGCAVWWPTHMLMSSACLCMWVLLPSYLCSGLVPSSLCALHGAPLFVFCGCLLTLGPFVNCIAYTHQARICTWPSVWLQIDVPAKHVHYKLSWEEMHHTAHKAPVNAQNSPTSLVWCSPPVTAAGRELCDQYRHFQVYLSRVSSRGQGSAELYLLRKRKHFQQLTCILACVLFNLKMQSCLFT